MNKLKVIIGAGEQKWEGWIPTHKENLDLTDRNTWKSWFNGEKADALLCEHVFEHLSEEDGLIAAKICFDFLKPGGFLRIAVPDRLFPNEAYQKMVQIGGPGPDDHPAKDHKIVYDYMKLSSVLKSSGFHIDLLEYCDENGRFHYNQWSISSGPIYRSLKMDPRNSGEKIGFVSLIIDAIKPNEI